MTHSALCKTYDLYKCTQCNNWLEKNVVTERVTEFHHGTDQCYDCKSYNITEHAWWWIEDLPKNVYAAIGDTITVKVTAWQCDNDGYPCDDFEFRYQWYYKNADSTEFKKSSIQKETYATQMEDYMVGRELYCVITDQYGYKQYSTVVTILASKLKITTQPKSVTLSAGESATFTVKATGSGLKYQWYYRDAGAEEWEKSTVTKSSYTTTMKQERDGREIYCEVKDGSGEILKTRIVTMKLPALKITKQPKNASAYEDEKAKTSVEATGDGLKYTWYYKDQGKDGFTKSTTTTATYSLTMNEARSGRIVYCQVRDAYGRTKDTNEVTLTMRHKATITSQPKSVTVSAGETAKFTIGATGDGIKYQWYYRNAGTETWKKASSTSDTYETAMKVERHGREVYCRVTDEYGNVAKSKTVTMKLPVAKVTVQPQNVTASDGKTVNFSIEATGDGLTYQWYYRNVGTTTWKKANSTSASYETLIKVDRDGRQVYCKVTDQYGFTAKSDTATMKLPAAKITSQPKSVTASAGEMVKFSVEATGDGLEYKWYYKNAGSSSWKVGSSTAASYETEMKADRDGRQIYCKVTDAYGNVVKSKTVTMNLPVVTITSHPKDVIADVGGTVKFTVSATGDGLTYQWYYKNSGSSTWSKSSYQTDTCSFTMKEGHDGRQVRCKVTDAYGKTVTSNAAVVKLEHPVVKITTQPKSAVVAAGAKATFTIKATGDGLTYQWQYKKSESSTWTNASSTSRTYSFTMKESYDGRSIRCKVKDAYDNMVTSNSVKLVLEQID